MSFFDCIKMYIYYMERNINGRRYIIAPNTNLSGADLSGANLSDADLRNADLSGANLSGVNLLHANLTGANLTGANLTSANLPGANLAGANLDHTNLRDANLAGAYLRGSILTYANLSGAYLNYTNLVGANLMGANLMRSHLAFVNLRGSYLRNVNMRDTNFSYVDFTDVNLEGVSLSPQQRRRVERQTQRTRRTRRQQPQPQPQPQGRAYEIHNAFNNLNINKLLEIIQSHLPSQTTNETNVNVIDPLINYVQNSNIPNKQQKNDELTRINNTISPTLNSSNYYDLKSKLKKVIQYILLQPSEFVELYLQNFTYDCLNAYNAGEQSCVKGMIERIIFAVRDVIATFCVEDGNPLCKPEYKELLSVFYPTINIDFNAFFQEWFSQNAESNEIINMNPTQRKEHFKHFVEQKINDNQRYNESIY
jgi:Pentapeptide repeats (8 copies)